MAAFSHLIDDLGSKCLKIDRISRGDQAFAGDDRRIFPCNLALVTSVLIDLYDFIFFPVAMMTVGWSSPSPALRRSWPGARRSIFPAAFAQPILSDTGWPFGFILGGAGLTVLAIANLALIGAPVGGQPETATLTAELAGCSCSLCAAL